jgi:hypothetical protein
VVFLFSKVNALRLQAILALRKIRDYLGDEAHDTKRMAELYSKYLRGKATKEEIKEANSELIDLAKNLGLGALILLPFSPITLPLIIKLSKKLGINIFPNPSKRKKNS